MIISWRKGILLRGFFCWCLNSDFILSFDSVFFRWGYRCFDMYVGGFFFV